MKAYHFLKSGFRPGWKPLIAVTTALALLAVVVAAVSTQSSGEVSAPAPVFPSLLRIGLSFAGVIALVYLLSMLLKRMDRRKQTRGNNFMNVLEVLPLGPKTKLVTVKLGQQVIVIGAGESSVNRITELGEAEYTAVCGQDENGPVVSFKDRLGKLARK